MLNAEIRFPNILVAIVAKRPCATFPESSASEMMVSDSVLFEP